MTHELRWHGWLAVAFVVGVGVLFAVPASHANTQQPQIHVGRIWHNPEADGAEGWDGSLLQYPGGIPRSGTDADANQCKRGWIGQVQKCGTYMMWTDWTDPQATHFDYGSSYFFRSMNYNYPAAYTSADPGGNMNYLYCLRPPLGQQEYYRWTRPTVRVDTTVYTFFPGPGDYTNPYYDSGLGPRPWPIINPNLVTEQAQWMSWRYIPGIDLQRMEYAYPYGSPHQDYILQDIKLVHTGISGREVDAPVDLTQPVKKVLWCQMIDVRAKGASSTLYEEARDIDAMYIQPWGASGHPAILTWDGDDGTAPGPDWGDPSENAFYENHLMANAYILYGPVFASAGTGSGYDLDDPIQPGFRIIYYERGFDFAGQRPYPTAATPQDQREWLTDGILQMNLNESYRTDPDVSGIKDQDPGPTAIMGYGPVFGDVNALDPANVTNHGWTFNPHDSVHIVQVLAAGGIDEDEGVRIGLAWNTARTAPTPPDPSTWMSAADIALVQSGRDTAMKAAALAYWNYYSTMPPNVMSTELTAWGIPTYVMNKPAAYIQSYNVPDAPRPPGYIYVHGATGIEIRWTKEAETAPDHDTKVADFAGYRIWRQDGTRMASWHVIASGPAGTFTDAAAAGDVPAGKLYIDNTVASQAFYWYAVTAYDDGTQNWAEPGKPLESARWWTWTGYRPLGVQTAVVSVRETARANAFALEQNAPNPFNPMTTIRYSVAANENVTLRIYDVNGRLVRTLVNGVVSPGVHEAIWEGNDANGRPVGSGVYLYRLVGKDKQISKRMSLVR